LTDTVRRSSRETTIVKESQTTAGQYLPLITTARLSLRWIVDEDLQAIYTVFSDPDVMRYWSTPPLRSLDEARELVAEIREGFQRGDLLQWGIARGTDNTIIGTTTLFHIVINHRAELGYALGREEWGKGYMLEALTGLLGYAFTQMKLHRVEADVDPRNSRSIRTLERLGFKKEGHLRERWKVSGEIQDALFYGLLRSEWSGGQT
jgi:RimJ/RimL family protein N-acetyltransferase